MRKYFVRNPKSNYHGDHIIFETEEEANQNGITCKRWWDPEIKAGDWVIADDGGVLQCLKYYKMTNKAGYTTHCYRFCNTTLSVYPRKCGETSISNFYAFFTKSCKSSIGEVKPLERSKIVAFAQMVMAGMPIYKSFMSLKLHGHRFGMVSSNAILSVVQSPLFRKTIMEEVKTLNKRVNEKFTDDYVIKEIESLLENTTKGSKEHRENIKFILSLKNPAEELSKRGKERRLLKGIEEAQIVEENELPPA